MAEIKGFKGRVPRFDSRLLPDTAAQTARNCKTDTGNLVPYKGTTVVNTPSKVGTKKTIFKYGLYWLSWLEDVDVVRGAIAKDTTGRLYWTGEGAPKVSDATMITAGGGTGYPTNSYTLGIPAPTTKPTVGVAGASTDPTQAESRAYVYSYVSAWGEEGPPSPPSSVIDVEPSQSVNITNMAVAPTGAYNITVKRIYRTATGTTGTEYLHVADVLIANTSYADSIATVNLGSAIVSTYWDMPPANLHSLKMHPSGFMVGISGKDICFSVPYMGHAWPESYRIAIKSQPVGLGIFGSSVLVLTDGQPEVITGTDPAYMTKELLEVNQACVSKRGIVEIGYAVAYPSPDGLILIGSGMAKNATENLFTRDQWQALNPSSILSAFHDGRYYGFSSVDKFIIDFTGEDVKNIDVAPTAVYSDLNSDTLFLQVGADIVSWDTGAALSLTWRSKIFVAPGPTPSPGVAQVRAAAYPVTFTLYADGTLKHTQTVTSQLPFRIAGGYYATEFEFQVVSTKTIYSVNTASTMSSL